MAKLICFIIKASKKRIFKMQRFLLSNCIKLNDIVTNNKFDYLDCFRFFNNSFAASKIVSLFYIRELKIILFIVFHCF